MKILVIGGGIIGAACAWELAQAGADVTLFERTTPGAEASGASAGILSPLGSGGPYEAMALASWRIYPKTVAALHEATGIDVEHVTRGSIYPLATTARIRQAERTTKHPAAAEMGIEAWDADELRSHEPALGPSIGAAMFVRGEQWINGERLTLAFAQAAKQAGAVLRLGERVTRILVEDGRARGVVVDDQRIAADAVLLAAGAWTGELATTFGACLPVEPKRGQMLALSHVPPVVQHLIHGDDVYLVPRPSGELLIGATVERVGFDRAVTADGIRTLLSAATRLVPALGALPMARTWCGFRPWAPDSLPIMGRWPDVAGLFVATAHFRNGIMMAPITATLMAEAILDGAPSMDLTPFSPDRFMRRTATQVRNP
jgi:glycine oxidase